MLGTEQQEPLYSDDAIEALYRDDFAEARVRDGLVAAYARQARLTRDGGQFAEGIICVAPIGDGRICEAKVVWDRDYGEQVLDVGPFADVTRRVAETLVYGPAFGPAYRSGLVQFLHHPIDGSYRMVTAQGEMRLKRFLQQRVVLFIPHNPGGRHEGEGVRIVLMWTAEVGPFVNNVHTRGSQWSRGRLLALFYCGRLHKLRVSNIPGELAFARLDDDTRLVLAPHASPEGGKPAQVEVQLVHVDILLGETTQRLGTCPIDADLAPDSLEQVIWTDGSGTLSRSWSQEPGREEPAEPGPVSARADRSAAPPTPRTAGTARLKVAPEVQEEQGPPHPAVVPLLIRYFGDLAEKSGVAKGLRNLVCRPGDGGEISPMMRACLRGVNLRGRGDALWRELEAAGDFTNVWHTRIRYYFLAQLECDSVVCRRCVNSTQRRLVFGEFCSLYSLGSRKLCVLYRTTPERVLAEWEASQAAGRGAAQEHHEPPPRAPPPPPPSTTPTAPASAPSAPTPTVRANTVDPVTPPPAVPHPPSMNEPPRPRPSSPTAVVAPSSDAPSFASDSHGDVAEPPPRQAPEPRSRSVAGQPEPPGPNPAKQTLPGPFRAPEPRPGPLTDEQPRFRRYYPSDDRKIEDIRDDDGDGDGTARGPPEER